MQKYQEELNSLKINPDNPFMKCLEPLFERSSEEPFNRLEEYYEGLLSTVFGKKRDYVLACLAKIRSLKKNRDIPI